MKIIPNWLDKYIKKYNLQVLKGVFIFALITLLIHFSYRYWVRRDYWPISHTMHVTHEWTARLVFDQSSWVVSNVLHLKMTPDTNQTMNFGKYGFIHINESCSGLKPILQFILLMILYPGPWKKKLWFIPMGVVIVHLTNLFRIIGLSVVIVTEPQYWHFSHDNLFRPFFYVIIFLLWVWWVERLSVPKKSST